MGEGGMEVGEERDHTPIATLSPPERPALRWAAMRAIFNVSLILRDKVTKQCSQTTTLKEKGRAEVGIEPRSFCLPA